MKLAQQLMETLSNEWDSKEFRDTYTDVLRQLIEAKVEGRAIVTPEMPKRPRAANLMKALEQSLKERPLAKAEARKAPARKRASPMRKKAEA